jgi:hypothetical protein
LLASAIGVLLGVAIGRGHWFEARSARNRGIGCVNRAVEV